MIINSVPLNWLSRTLNSRSLPSQPNRSPKTRDTALRGRLSKGSMSSWQAYGYRLCIIQIVNLDLTGQSRDTGISAVCTCQKGRKEKGIWDKTK